MPLKRELTRALAMLMAFGILTACVGNTETPTQTTTQPTEATEPTQPGEEGTMLKVLNLGHSALKRIKKYHFDRAVSAKQFTPQ